MGGEACPAELAARLQAPGREVWNTYGPTEATVVACGTILDGTDPVRIGLPLDGWDLAVVDAAGPAGRGGRDRRADHRRRRAGPLPRPGQGRREVRRRCPPSAGTAPTAPATWCATTRPGWSSAAAPTTRSSSAAAASSSARSTASCSGCRASSRAAAAVRSTKSGNQLLVGYLTVDETYDDARRPRAAAGSGCPRRWCRASPSSTACPPVRRARSTATRCPGRSPAHARPRRRSGSPTTQAWIAEIWADVLGAEVTSVRDDFFDFGGGSLTAAQVVGRLRERFPEVAVGDLYAHSRIGAAVGRARGARRHHRRAPTARSSRSPARPRPASSPPWSACARWPRPAG